MKTSDRKQTHERKLREYQQIHKIIGKDLEKIEATLKGHARGEKQRLDRDATGAQVEYASQRSWLYREAAATLDRARAILEDIETSVTEETARER